MEFDAKTPTWAKIELFGHSCYWGRVREIEAYGGRMGIIESLTPHGFSPEPVIFGAGALFRVTPMSENSVRRAALPHSYVPCDSFEEAPILPEHCASCGWTAVEHDQEKRLLAAAPETHREGQEEPEDDIPFDQGRVVDLREARRIA